MSTPQSPPKAGLLVAIMFTKSNISLLKELKSTLQSKFGPVSIEGPEIDFTFTRFYEKEFGSQLKKRYLFYRGFDISNLPPAKVFCQQLENEYSLDGKRQFNIDPGYITKNCVVFASYKARSHRIYIGEKVYADLQLVYENGRWKSFSWTFPDIMDGQVIAFLTDIKHQLTVALL